MTERDYAPLSIACVRGLCDKLYEKRKFAGVEIEKMVKDFSDANNTSQIKRLVRVLGQDLIASTNPNVKNGALMGLSSVAVGLGKGCIAYLPELVHPTVACFSESDARVRYQAAEALFNVVKVARGAALAHFPLLFDALARLAADAEPQVRQAAELLDRLVKEIVTESEEFSVSAFVPMLRERMYTRHAAARQFCVSWLSVLDSVPALPLRDHLPDLLDPLLLMLADPHPEIRRMCDIQLSEFLRSIKKEPARVDFAAMINILITHAQSTEELVQLTAVTWIKEFVELSGGGMLPYASGVLAAALPCLAYSDEPRRSIREMATIVNMQLTKLVEAECRAPEPDAPSAERELAGQLHAPSAERELAGQLHAPSAERELAGQLHAPSAERELASQLHAPSAERELAGQLHAPSAERELAGQLHALAVDSLPPAAGPEGIQLEAVVDVLIQMVHHNSVHTKVAALEWFLHLYGKLPRQMSQQSGRVFVSAVGSLTDAADEVVRRSLAVMAEICTCPGTPGDLESSPYYYKFLQALLRLLAADENLLEDRGAFIIRQLCVLLNAEDIYKALSRILLEEPNLKFAATVVDVLGSILLTAAELHHLRLQLRNFSSKATRELFAGLYRCWCHSPVALLALCLLTHNYTHCNALISTFGELEITVDFLTELDKLVQLIESPIFAYMRLELLGGAASAELRGALYGLLMLLPQSDAFHTLRRRLQCAPALSTPSPSPRPAEGEAGAGLDFAALLRDFRRVQLAHRRYRLLPRGRRPARASSPPKGVH